MTQMKLETAAAIEAGKTTLLQFTPVNTNNTDTIVELETIHAQKLHLIIVSEDLSFFSHQHPQLNGSSYQLAFTFPAAGNYLLYADYKPVGQAAVVEQLLVRVEGATTTPMRFEEEALTARHNDVTVQLDTRHKAAIKAVIYKDENKLAASGIDEFLGAKAHVVMIHTKDKDFLHVHPMVHGEDLVLHASFSKTGLYRAWVQFLVEGKLYTTDFVLQVDKLPAPSHRMHQHH